MAAIANRYAFSSDAATIGKMLKAFKVANSKMHEMVHAIGVSCIMHALEFGNCTPANDFIAAFDVNDVKKNNGWRVNHLREWFERNGPFTFNKETKKLGMSSDKREAINAAGFKAEEIKSFWAEKPEPEYRGLDFTAELVRLYNKGTAALKEPDEAKRKKNKVSPEMVETIGKFLGLKAA